MKSARLSVVFPASSPNVGDVFSLNNVVGVAEHATVIGWGVSGLALRINLLSPFADASYALIHTNDGGTQIQVTSVKREVDYIEFEFITSAGVMFDVLLMGD